MSCAVMFLTYEGGMGFSLASYAVLEGDESASNACNDLESPD